MRAWTIVLLLLAAAGPALAQQPPEASDDSYATPAGVNLRVDAPGVLSNDMDPDGDPLTAFLFTGSVEGGVVDVAEDGSFEYEPPEEFIGTDSFTYRAYDGASFSNVATVEVTVTENFGDGVYLNEADFRAALFTLGFAAHPEGFEDDAAWGAVRSTISGGQFTAPSVTSQFVTWTSNNPVSEVTTGPGPARTGQWGFFTLPHGNQATGTDCHIPGNCTDGWVGTSGMTLYAVGAWITGTFGGKIEFFLDGDTANPVGFGDNAGITAGHRFFGVVASAGFTTFEVHELEGAAEDQKFIFADDFLFGVLPADVRLTVSRGPGPLEVTLQWIGGQPSFTVFRSDAADELYDPPRELGQTGLRTWPDTPPQGHLFFYGVTGQ